MVRPVLQDMAELILMKVAAYVTLISSQSQLAGTQGERVGAVERRAGGVVAGQVSLVMMIPVTRCELRLTQA